MLDHVWKERDRVPYIYDEDQGVDVDGQSLRDSAGIVGVLCISEDPPSQSR